MKRENEKWKTVFKINAIDSILGENEQQKNYTMLAPIGRLCTIHLCI